MIENIWKIYKINSTDSIFPECFRKIKNPPKCIYAIGNIQLLKDTAIAIIGSRNSSEYGEKMAKIITEELTEYGLVIVSGLAVGIDTVAHRTCLGLKGKTIAVIGGGFNKIYPKENEGLFNEILKNDGLVISEFSPNTEAKMKNFPSRNRLISAISSGVVVVEATYRSGTSVTAKFAKAQGKKVFCIPNGVGNKNSSGIINLLRNGAILVRNGSDVVKEIDYKNHKITKKEDKQIRFFDEESMKIINCIKSNRHVDSEKIVAETGLDIIKVNQLLSLLEIEEVIKFEKNYYELVEL